MINLSAQAHRQATRFHPLVPLFAGEKRMGRDVFALLCPDWRGPSFVLEGTGGMVAYANWRGLKLLEQGGPLRNGSRLTLDPPEANRRFYALLERMFETGQEQAVMALRDEAAGHWLALRVSLAHGFLREVMTQQLREDVDAGRLAVLEVAAGAGAPEATALAALGKAMGLAPAEEQLVLALVMGRTAEEIAAARNSSLSTVRQRIKSVLAKAGCSKQSELVGLIRMLCPPQS